ncbi:two-component system, OmpR family, sensor histidine kinase TctE [Modicisalibacter ilicicola DSM 19980]|uniref:histidine kinase n=1 Tax=Modicisalibacter ilicicola DSM 19980 TaxID=1121942 RepID=A0A1M4YI58_9GAMM|nr:sensor histidine kinase [Halomonas ilicicola]SHF05348.1 two-component system, OmpR family, sensor histidine kinase TctE [Halomonas ilicicola DSM 19980]
MSVRNSLYWRLLAWLLLPLLGLAALMLWQAYLGARDTADRAFDRLLEAASLAIAEQVKWQDNRLWLDLPPAALEMLATDAEERVFYALYATGDEFVTGNARLPALEGGGTALRFADVGWQDQTLRLGVREARLEDWDQQERFEVRVAHTREGREALAFSLFQGSLARVALLALLATGVLVLAIRFALAPLTRLRRAIRARDPRTLAPLELALPRELAELRETLNELLSRMRRVRANQERFIGDASHQLRTPLAGLSARAELALRQNDPDAWRDALQAMRTTSASAAHLAVQLLSLTRLNNPEATPELEPLDLTRVARRATRHALSACQRAGIDLGVETPESAVIVSGIDWQLEEALANLIDNARRYGSQGRDDPCVTVRVNASPPALEVEDNGPGIPAHLRLMVLRPFFRGQAPGEGSGLGLAIVDGIARSHGARLSLEEAYSGHGLRAIIRFPEAHA